MMKKRSNQIRKINFKILLGGILLSYIVTNLILSPQIQPDRFLAAGQVYEVRQSSLTSSNETWMYNEQQEYYTITGNDAKKSYGKWNEAVDWKCIYLKLDKLNRGSVDWVIKAYDEKDSFVGQQIVTLQNGKNWIKINIGVPFQKFAIQIIGAEGLQFQIEEMVLLEEIPQKRNGIILIFAILLVFLLCCMVVQRKCPTAKEHGRFLDKIWDFLHFFYRLVGNSERFALGKTWSRQKKNRVRTGLFFFLFVYMLIVYNQNMYFGNMYFQYNSLVFVIVMLGVTLISNEKKLKECKWNSKIARYWLAFWLFVCVSDFVVSKRIRFIGWIMLLVGGLFLLVWKHMQYPKDIIKNLLCAVELIAVTGVVYNMVFRLKYDGLLYNGYMKTSADFGVFSAFLCLVFLVEIYSCWKNCDFGKNMALYLCGVAVSVLQVILSGKKIAICYILILAIIAFVGVVKNYRQLPVRDKKKLVGYVVIAVGTVYVYYLAVKNIPWNLQTMVTYKGETYQSNKDASVIGTLASSGIEIYQNVKLSKQSLEEQVLVCKAYLREMNLFGHNHTDITVWNEHQSGQNQILQIMYRYGILAVISYILLFWEAGKKALAHLKKSWKNWENMELLSAGVIFFWWLVGFFGTVEYPFYQPAWVFVYLLLGGYIIDEE